MRNIKLILEYDGGRYHGWQRQTEKKSTVQGRIEFVLNQMTEENIELNGAGRTDAGVHALAQVANFKTNSGLRIPEMKAYLDQYFPDDIRLVDIAEEDENFHSRYNAKGKVYRYQLWNADVKNIFERRYYYQVREKLDLGRMKSAAAYFIGEQDFKSFTATISKNKSTVRRIDSIEILRDESKIFITFKGDGFLHKMVRIITGTIIQAGLGEIRPEDIPGMLAGKTRADAGFTAAPHALFLMKVLY